MYSGPSIEELKSRASEEYSVSTRKRGKIAVVAGMIGNIAVCIVKFVAAFISGSSAMLSEAIHSVVDSCDGVFMLLGLHRANRKPDYLHPFGYGKELYFWTMVVALLVFFMGGGMSLVKGVQSIQETMAGTHVLGDTTLNFIVIAAGMVIEGITLGIGIRQFNAARGDAGPIKFIRDAKDPSLYTVVLEDSAAELGLCFALVSTIVCDVTGNLYFDGVASILIGILLCFVAIILLRETKGLLVGEGMKHQSLDELRDIVEADDRVISCGRILTMYMGPEDLLIAIDATFKTELSAHEVLLTVDDLERRALAAGAFCLHRGGVHEVGAAPEDRRGELGRRVRRRVRRRGRRGVRRARARAPRTEAHRGRDPAQDLREDPKRRGKGSARRTRDARRRPRALALQPGVSEQLHRLLGPCLIHGGKAEHDEVFRRI